jgi:HlyD family secretion protein
MKKKTVLTIAGTVASGGILAWGSSLWQSSVNSQKVTPSPSPTATTAQVGALGRVQPAGEVIKVSAPLTLDGDRLKELRVKEGDRVNGGEVIAVLDAVDRFSAAVVQAQQQVNVARAKLARVRSGAKRGEIAAQEATIARVRVQLLAEERAQRETIARIQAQWEGERRTQQATIGRIQAQWEGDRRAQQATIARLTAELGNTQVEYDRYRQLASQGAISASSLDGKKLAVVTAGRQLQEATAVLARIESTSRQQLREAEANLQRIDRTNTGQINEAKAGLVKIRDTGNGQVNEAAANLHRIAEVNPTEVAEVQSEVDNAVAAEMRARTELEQAYIRAPSAGQILRINYRNGEKVGDRGIVELAETNEMMVVAEVYQTDVNNIKIGQIAKANTSALSEDLTGTVAEIGRQIDRQKVFSSQPGENLDRRIIEVKIKLDPNSSLRVANLTNLQVRVSFSAN